MWYWIVIGAAVGIFIGAAIAIDVMIKLEKQCVGRLQIYDDSTDGQQYLFCDLDKGLDHIKKQKMVVFAVEDRTNREDYSSYNG